MTSPCKPKPSPEDALAALLTLAAFLAPESAPPAAPAVFFTSDKAIREKVGHSARSLNEAACAGALEAVKTGRGWRFTAAALAAWESTRIDGRGRRTRAPSPAPANDAAEASRARLAAVGGVARRAG